MTDKAQSSATCTCLPYVAGGDGPEVDCPVHGCPGCWDVAELALPCAMCGRQS